MKAGPLTAAGFAFVALPGLLVVAEALAWALGHPVLPAVETITGAWCHHDPTRAVSIGHRLLPVCARCTGMYGGLVVGVPLGALLPWKGRVLLPLLLLAAGTMTLGLGAAVAEALGVVQTTNGTRVALGLLLTTGPAALGIVGSRILGQALADATGSRPPRSTTDPPAGR